MQKSILKEYSRLAKVYDKRWSFYVEATTRKTIEKLNLRVTDELLDLGCGTGVLLQELSKTHSAEQLFGLDPVAAMLDIAKGKLSSSIQLQEGWASHIPFKEDKFDLVVSSSMFHYIRDPQTALNEIYRVLRPGGCLIITAWCNDFFTMRIADFFLRNFNKAHFKSYRSKNIKELLQKNKFTVLNIDRYKINCWWGLMTIEAQKNKSTCIQDSFL